MKVALIFSALFFLYLQEAFAKPSYLNKTLNKYANAKSIQTEIKKIDEKIILGTKSESTGLLKYQKNKIYISQDGEKKVEFFYNNKTLTLVEYPDADFDKNASRKVTTLKKNIPPMINSLLNLFSNPKNFKKEFKVISEKKENHEVIIELKPSDKNLKNFTLKVNAKNSEILEISFVDDVDTKTTLLLNNLKINATINNKDFQFSKLNTDEELSE